MRLKYPLPLASLILLGIAGSSWAGSATIGSYDSGECYPYSCGYTDELTEWQQHFAASAFGVTGTISIQDFVLTAWAGNFYPPSADTGTFKVYLSTAAHTLGNDSSNLASNKGADNTLFASVTFGPGMPASFTVTGTTPFSYNPANGDLLIDVQFTGSSSVLGYYGSWFNGDQTGAVTLMNYTSTIYGANANALGGLVTIFDYTGGTPITQSQTITFGSLSNVTFGVPPFTIAATASSGLPVSFASTTGPVCTVSGTTVTILAGGTCSITATQAGNASYSAAAPVMQSFTVNPANQTISFSLVGSVTYGVSPFAISATASSGLPVSFVSMTAAVCLVSGNTVTITETGTCSIVATQPGNATFNAATPVTLSLTVNAANQTIAFGPLSGVTLGAAPFALTATASSGLAVTFTSITPAVCAVSGTTVTLLAAGSCSITASQSGNANYNPATPITQSFSVSPNTTFTVSPSAVTTSLPAGNATSIQGVSLTYVTSTAGSVSFSASVSTNQGTGWLRASAASIVTGSSSPATFQGTGLITVTTAGLVPGTYTGAVTFTTNTGSSTAVGVTLTVLPSLTVAPSALSFNYRLGDSTGPTAQNIAAFGIPSGVSYTAYSSTSSGGNWLVVPAFLSGTTPGSIPVSINTTQLSSPGTLSGQVTVTPTGGNAVTVPVTLTVLAAAPPVLSASLGNQVFVLPQNGPAANGALTVSNAGGGVLNFSIQTSSTPSSWLKLNGATTGSATDLSPASVGFIVNPAGLAPGVYSGNIAVTAPGASSSFPITLEVTQASPQLELSQAGLTFTAIAGGAAPQQQSFSVLNGGAGSLNWTAQPASTANWIQLTTTSGTAAGGQPGSVVGVSVNPSGLAAGQYYGSISISTTGSAVNSSQSVSVLLNVTPSAPIGISSGGVTLVGAAGSSAAPQQQIILFNPAGVANTFTAAASASWLTVSPASGTLAPGGNPINIQANLSGVTAGVENGTVTLLFGDGSAATINVLLIATGSTASRTTAVAPIRKQAIASACAGGQASTLIPNFVQPVGQSTVQATAAQLVRVEIVDDCGNPVTATGGAAQVTFSNQDAALMLQDVGGGFWEGTWIPITAAAQVTLSVAATEGSLTSAIAASVTVAVQAAGATSAGAPSAIVNAALGPQATPRVVTPGGYITIYGINMAGSGTPQASNIPLPATLNGTQVFLGSQQMPLLYAAPGQVNAVIPQNLAPNASYPLVVVRGATQSVPVQLTSVELQPGIYTEDGSGSGQGIVTIANTSLLAAPAGANARPAVRGTDYITIYCTGLGAVQTQGGAPPPADGVAAPVDLLYETTANVTVTIGGVTVTPTFAGLTPTLVALYQINVPVPATAPAGNAVPVVLTVTDPTTGGIAQSNSVTIALQ